MILATDCHPPIPAPMDGSWTVNQGHIFSEHLKCTEPGVNTDPLGGLDLADALLPHPFLFCLPIHRLVFLWLPEANPSAPRIWMCLLVHYLLHFLFFSKYLRVPTWERWPLLQMMPFPSSYISLRCLLVSANPRITESLRLCGGLLLRIFYVSGFGRAGCDCFSISRLLSLKVQTQGSIPASLWTQLPFFLVLARNESLIEFHLSKLWENDRLVPPINS